MAKKLFLLDGHSLAHRAFYALPLLTNSRGEYTNAVFGFTRMLFKLLDDEEPDLIAVTFDKKGPTFRHEQYEKYKANRKEMPVELAPQISLIKKVVEVLQIPRFAVDGYEADDLLGTLAKTAEKEDLEVYIVSGDRDTLQLVSDKIKVLYTKKGISDLTEYDKSQIKEEFELSPEQLIDLKGLVGDSSDNIPGVPLIGKKTATKLLKEFSTMEGVLANVEQISGKKRKENLQKYSAQAQLSKELGTIDTEVPLEIDLEECVYQQPESSEIISLFEELGFGSLIDRFMEKKEINSQGINLQELSDRDELTALIKTLGNKKEFGCTILLKDINNPVTSPVNELLIATGHNEIYKINTADFEPRLFASVFANPKIKKHLLHAKEVLIFLKRNNLKLRGLEFDPLLAAYLLNPAHKLPTISDLLTGELDLILEEDISQEKEAAFLLAHSWQLKEKLFARLESKELIKLYQEIEIPLIKVLAEMEYNGIKVNTDFLQELSQKWEKRLVKITKKAYQLAGEEFNLNSPKQLGEIMFEKLGLPVIKKTKTGYATGIDVLEELKDQHEIIPLIIEYRQWAKFKSTYVDALPPLINLATGRIHTSFNQMVTATGRLSSTDPNLQNIPIRTREGRLIRKAFIPENEEWLLLAADYSQVELRVLAEISHDEGLGMAFRKGRDIHTETATEVFAVPPEEVTSGMRREAKVINFGIAYGMSSYGLAQDLDISRKEAQAYIDRYFNKFPKVKEYMDKVIKQAKEQSYVTTIFNRRRYIPEIRSRNYHRRSFAERTAINTPIQGSAADIMKIAMINVYNAMKTGNYQVRILLQVHDELVLEVKKEDLKTVATLVKKEMEQAVEFKVPLVVELQTGENWKDKKDYQIDFPLNTKEKTKKAKSATTVSQPQTKKKKEQDHSSSGKSKSRQLEIGDYQCPNYRK